MISNYSFSLILSFYSLLEFLLDVLYAFERPKIAFSKYKKKKWFERFEQVFPVNSNEEANTLLTELKDIKNNYRNPLAHGLFSEANLLVSMPYIGLIPLSYKYLSNRIYYGFLNMEKEDALKIISIFRRFLKFVNKEEPYRFYMLYIDYDFPIPINKKTILEIKQKMAKYEEFKKYLDERSRYEDMVINRDI